MNQYKRILFDDEKKLTLLCDGFLRFHFPKIRLDDISSIIVNYLFSCDLEPLHNPKATNIEGKYDIQSKKWVYYCTFRQNIQQSQNKKSNKPPKNQRSRDSHEGTSILFVPLLSKIISFYHKSKFKYPFQSKSPKNLQQLITNTNKHKLKISFKLTICDCNAKCYVNQGYIIQFGLFQIEVDQKSELCKKANMPGSMINKPNSKRYNIKTDSATFIRVIQTQVKPIYATNRVSLHDNVELLQKAFGDIDEYYMSWYNRKLTVHNALCSYNCYLNGVEKISESRTYDQNIDWKLNDECDMYVDYNFCVKDNYNCRLNEGVLYWIKNGNLMGKNIDSNRFQQGKAKLDFQNFDYMLGIGAPLCDCTSDCKGYQLTMSISVM